MARSRGSVEEAVLFLFDDAEHSFNDVSAALEDLGIPPPIALLLTTEINTLGFNVVSKGSVVELHGAAEVLRAKHLNASVVRTTEVDAQIVRSVWKIHATLTKSEVPQQDLLPECPRWALAGACARQPLGMLTRCETSCSRLSRNYMQAAMARQRPPALPMAAEQLALLAVVWLGALLFTRRGSGGSGGGGGVSDGGGSGGGDPHGARRRLWGLSVATVFLTSHFLVDGLSELAFGQTGFVVDDAEGVVILEEPLPTNLSSPLHHDGMGGAGSVAPAAVAPSGLWTGLWTSVATAGVGWANALGRTPPGAKEAFACAECAAALLAASTYLYDAGGCTPDATGSETVRRRLLRLSGGTLLAVSLLGALHVGLSVLVMATLGAGIHLSELMAKRVALVGAMALWTAPAWHPRPPGGRAHDGAGRHCKPTAAAAGGLLPTYFPAAASSPQGWSPWGCGRPALLAAEEESSAVAGGEGGTDGTHAAWSSSLLLLLGRVGIAALLLYVCGTELVRLLATPLTYLGEDGVPSSRTYESASARYLHHIAHEHSEVAVRGPQLLLALPLALGVETSRVATALALLSAIEAALVWQWWQPQVLADPLRLSRCVEHFTVNLAISGGLLLLPLRGSGHFTLDRLMAKKKD